MKNGSNKKSNECDAFGKKGTLKLLPIKDLIVDHRYQREIRNNRGRPTEKIANRFNWVGFGVPIVMCRSNGKYYVVDGQHRVMAASECGIKEVPCMVFESDGVTHEALGFVDANVNRINVSTTNRYRASVLAGVDPEKSINDWVESIGMSVIAGRKSSKHIGFPTQLVRTWKTNPEHCKEAILLQRRVNAGGGDLLHWLPHAGFCWLLQKGVNVSAYEKKFIEAGGRAALLRAIKSAEIEMGGGAGTLSYTIAGYGVLQLINHRLRKKISVS